MASFEKIPSNNKQGYKWICTKDAPPDPVTGKRRQIKRRGDTKKEAEARVDKAIRDLTEHNIDHKVIKNLPFEKVASEWLPVYAKGNRKKGTVRIREKEVKLLNKYIAKVNIDKVTHKNIQDILFNLFDQGYADSTIEGVKITANFIFTYAVKCNYRKDNPCVGLVMPVRKKTVEEIENNPIEEKFLETYELEEFLNATRKHGLYGDFEMFHLLAFSGMRPGELCVLKENDFNFKDNTIRISKTMYNPNNNMKEYELETPKTDASARTPDIDESIMALMKDFIKKSAKIRMSVKNFDPEYHGENFVFVNDKGYPIIQKTINRRMKRILRKTSITKEATPHIFRHTHISMLAEAGVDLYTIMKRVGHDDPKTTMAIYLHVTERMKKSAGEKVKTHFSSILSKVIQQGM